MPAGKEGRVMRVRGDMLLIGCRSAQRLLFVGIHNAWDAITYHVFVKKREQREAERHG
jgi:hypothetical protein